MFGGNKMKAGPNVLITKVKPLQDEIDKTINIIENLSKVDINYINLLKHLGQSYLDLAFYLKKAAKWYDGDNKDLYLK